MITADAVRRGRLRALRPFNSLWLCLFAFAIFSHVRLWRRHPNTTAWLIGKFSILGLLLASLLAELVSQIRERRRRNG